MEQSEKPQVTARIRRAREDVKDLARQMAEARRELGEAEAGLNVGRVKRFVRNLQD